MGVQWGDKFWSVRFFAKCQVLSGSQLQFLQNGRWHKQYLHCLLASLASGQGRTKPFWPLASIKLLTGPRVFPAFSKEMFSLDVLCHKIPGQFLTPVLTKIEPRKTKRSLALLKITYDGILEFFYLNTWCCMHQSEHFVEISSSVMKSVLLSGYLWFKYHKLDALWSH